MTDTAPTGQLVMRSRQSLPAPAQAAGPSPIQIDMEVARQLAASEIVPSTYRGKPANVLVAIGLGRSLGLEPAPSLYGMHVIEGTPSPTAKLQAALVRRAGHKLRILENSAERAVVQIVRHDDPDYPVTVEFTADDARAAGLLAVTVDQWIKVDGRNKKQSHVLPEDFPVPCSVEDLKAAGAPDWAKPYMVKRRDPWFTQRKVMLHHRAVTTAVGMACPEVASGLDFELGGFDDEPPAVDPVDVLTTSTAGPVPDPDPAPAPETVATAEPEPAADIVDAEVIADPEPAPDTPDADPETLPLTAETLKVRISTMGQKQSDVIRKAAEIAAEQGVDAPGSLTQIVASPVLPAVLAWLDSMEADF